MGLGAFAAIGADITTAQCQRLGIESCWLLVIMLSSSNAAGGGVVRDILAGEVPQILKREIYATAAAAGGLVYLLTLPLGREAAMLATISAVTITRVLSLQRGWELPKVRQ